MSILVAVDEQEGKEQSKQSKQKDKETENEAKWYLSKCQTHYSSKCVKGKENMREKETKEKTSPLLHLVLLSLQENLMPAAIMHA